MKRYECFRVCPGGNVDYLGTVEAETLTEATDWASWRWTIDKEAGEELSVEEDEETDQ